MCLGRFDSIGNQLTVDSGIPVLHQLAPFIEIGGQHPLALHCSNLICDQLYPILPLYPKILHPLIKIILSSLVPLPPLHNLYQRLPYNIHQSPQISTLPHRSQRCSCIPWPCQKQRVSWRSPLSHGPSPTPYPYQ